MILGPSSLNRERIHLNSSVPGAELPSTTTLCCFARFILVTQQGCSYWPSLPPSLRLWFSAQGPWHGICTYLGRAGWMASLTQWTWVWASCKDGEGQGNLACCSPLGCKKSDTTERLNNNKDVELVCVFSHSVVSSSFETPWSLAYIHIMRDCTKNGRFLNPGKSPQSQSSVNFQS